MTVSGNFGETVAPCAAGLTYGGGIGSLSGTVRNEELHVDVEYPPPTFMPILSNPRETVTDGDINDLYSPSVVAIGSVECGRCVHSCPRT